MAQADVACKVLETMGALTLSGRGRNVDCCKALAFCGPAIRPASIKFSALRQAVFPLENDQFRSRGRCCCANKRRADQRYRSVQTCLLIHNSMHTVRMAFSWWRTFLTRQRCSACATSSPNSLPMPPVSANTPRSMIWSLPTPRNNRVCAASKHLTSGTRYSGNWRNLRS